MDSEIYNIWLIDWLINDSMQPQQNDSTKRKQHIIYSDSEESQD